ncbi:uncharacterized protein G2W53_000977 [Senna tora]|uniref:Uncharacterized protein n=1 Tax=Senna tora TaxID=362788 RepID=A0A834XGX8_9FABA|nr:uncharacterized protein G2W53_000977 [Senna tora]
MALGPLNLLKSKEGGNETPGLARDRAGRSQPKKNIAIGFRTTLDRDLHVAWSRPKGRHIAGNHAIGLNEALMGLMTFKHDSGSTLPLRSSARGPIKRRVSGRDPSGWSRDLKFAGRNRGLFVLKFFECFISASWERTPSLDLYPTGRNHGPKTQYFMCSYMF